MDKYHITKKVGESIMKALPGILKECNFEPLPPDSWHEDIKQSRGGFVEVSVRCEKAYKSRGCSVSVYGVYADPDKAQKAGIDCNPYSGKYNHHFIQSIEHLRYCLNQYR